MLDRGHPVGNLFHLVLDTDKGLFDRRLHVGQSPAKFDFDRKLQIVPNLRLASFKALGIILSRQSKRELPDFQSSLQCS